MELLYARDIRREPGMDKLPPMARLYLYPGSNLEARSRFPSLPPQTVASIEQATSKKYRTRRYEVIWTGVRRFRTTAPRCRPVHNQSWSALILNGRPVVSLRLGEAWVRLNSGPQFHRQINPFAPLPAARRPRVSLRSMNQQQHQPICPANALCTAAVVGA